MAGTLPPPQVQQAPGFLLLTSPWCRVMSIGWSGLALALVCTGISSHIIGRPVFWLDDQRWPIVLVCAFAILVVGPSFLTALWSYANRPSIPIVSGVASAVLIGAAVADRHGSPGAAVVEGALACAATLLTAASFVVRVRPQRPGG